MTELSANTQALLSIYNTRKAELDAAINAHHSATEAARVAKQARDAAALALIDAKKNLDAAIWQDIDPMPLVPAPRTDTMSTRCVEFVFDEFAPIKSFLNIPRP